MTQVEFEFSRERLKRTSGSIASDREYLRWYCDTCVRNIQTAVAAIALMFDGGAPFDREMPSTLAAHVATMRFASFALQDAAEFFKNKREIAEMFADGHERRRAAIEQAEEQAKEIHRWLTI